MADNSEESWERQVQDLKDAFAQLAGANDETLSDLKTLQGMAHTLYQYEAARLKRTLGATDPRVRQLEAQMSNSLELLKGLRTELETAKVQTPQVPEGGTLVDGRISDKANRGLPGLVVYTETDKGLLLRPVGSAETDASGHYVLKLDAGMLKKLEKTEIYLAVATRLGKAVVHREAKPLELGPGKRLVLNVTLDAGLFFRKE